MILLGLMMTLVSILLEQFVVVNMDQELAQKRGKVTELNYVIEQKWLNSQAQAQRALLSELVILLSGVERPNLGLKEYLKQLIEDLRFKGQLPQTQTMSQYNQLLKKVLGEYRESSLDFINDRYLQRVNLEKEIVALQMSQSRWKKVALLLQVLGLILILSREIFRH
ncbi:hypothetical protein BGC07_06440 [Piscirickettsia litoralis]|uniref:Uncharacterized protein n=1 Tax=Piscirickettsia litoralis TaxID=1891921 RepID=A0ABX3A5U6_9GAMM|nr:hypothetical protein BGC07_06440 [Piscirickettsia litoralis]